MVDARVEGTSQWARVSGRGWWKQGNFAWEGCWVFHRVRTGIAETGRVIVAPCRSWRWGLKILCKGTCSTGGTILFVPFIENLRTPTLSQSAQRMGHPYPGGTEEIKNLGQPPLRVQSSRARAPAPHKLEARSLYIWNALLLQAEFVALAYFFPVDDIPPGG